MMDSSTIENKTNDPNNQLLIVLRLEEGIGFSNGCDKIYCEGIISGNKIDQGPTNTAHTTNFDCNFIWETERKAIKRMKIENIPVKINVYAVKSKSEKEHIGYILIPVRSIPLLPLSKAIQTKCRWQKLIGLNKEWRNHRPEILLSIFITDSSFLTCDKTTKHAETQSIGSHEIIVDENPNPCLMMTSNKGLFIRLLQREGLLQVGNIDTDCDIFNVKILIKNIKYLNVLSQGVSSDHEFFINYILLGNNHSRKLDRKFNRTYQIQEKISINFRSSLKSLREYFEEIFYIPIEVYMDSRMIGKTEIRLTQLISTFELTEFLNTNKKCYEFEDVIDIKTQLPLDEKEVTNKPVLEYKALIQYQATRKLHQLVMLDKQMSEIDHGAGGDTIREVIKDDENSKIFETQPKSNTLSSKAEANTNTSHLFSYNMQIDYIKFNKKPPKGVWQISFFHEKADTPRTYVNREIQEDEIIDNSIKLNDLELKLYFTSNINEISDVIKSSDSCTVCIKGPYNTHVKANLNCRNLEDKIQGNILLSSQNESVTAFAQITASIIDEGFNFNSKMSQCLDEDKISENLIDEHKKWLFDEKIAYNMILELEEWKNFERNKFVSDLKRKEKDYFDNLVKKFEDMKAKYEEKLIEKNKRLDELTISLEEAKATIDNENLKKLAMRENHQIHAIKSEIHKEYNEKLLMIKEETVKLEKDLMSHIDMKDTQIKQSEAANSRLQNENFEMKSTIERLETDYELLKLNSVPKSELENLLEELRTLNEKLNESQQSKIFYKTQWAKLFRESHMDRKEKTNILKDEFFDLRTDNLCDLISCEHAKLNFDKEELDEIKSLLDV